VRDQGFRRVLSIFSFRERNTGGHGQSFRAVSPTGRDLGFVCGGVSPLRTFSSALVRAGLLDDAHQALLGPYRIATSLASRRRFTLLERHEQSTEDAVQTIDETVMLHVTEGVGHLVRLV
jgi:hypothetical protein